MNFCPNCGTKLDNPGTPFCPNCGFQLAAQPASQEPPAPINKPAFSGATAPGDDAFRAPSGGSSFGSNAFDSASGGASSDAFGPEPHDSPSAAHTAPGQSIFNIPLRDDATTAAPETPASVAPAPPTAGGHPAPRVFDYDAPEEPEPPAPKAEAKRQPPQFFDLDEPFNASDADLPGLEISTGGEAPRTAPAPRTEVRPQPQRVTSDDLTSLLNAVQKPRPAAAAATTAAALAQLDEQTDAAVSAFDGTDARQQDLFGAAAGQGEGTPFVRAASTEAAGESTSVENFFPQDAPVQNISAAAVPQFTAPRGESAEPGLFDDAQPTEEPAAEEPAGDLFAGAERAPASLDETRIFSAPPQREAAESAHAAAPYYSQERPRSTAAPRQMQRSQYPPSPAAQPANQAQAVDNVFAAQLENDVHPYTPPVPGSAAAERAKRAAMVANISQVAQEGTAPIPPYNEDPYAPTPRTPSAKAPRAAGKPAPRQRAQAVQMMDDYDDSPRRSRGSIIGMVLIFVLIFAIVTAMATVGLLYWRNRPATVIDAYSTALESKDVATLDDLVALNGISPTVAGWEAMCAEFENADNLKTLEGELAKVNVKATNSSLQYPSIRLVGEDLFLFIKKYHVEATGVSALAPGAADGSVLRLNGEDHTGAAADGGQLYQNIMPGKYSCIVMGADGVSGTETTESIFAISAPTAIGQGAAASGGSSSGAAATAATVTVQNCMNDEATLYINDLIMPEKPTDGVVTLANVPVGAVIKTTAEKDGKVYESSVTFSDAANTNLRFDNYAEVDVAKTDDPTEYAKNTSVDQINSDLAVFYQSYLTCINEQKTDSMQNVTESEKQALLARVTNADNAANTYKYISCSAKAESMKAGEQDGLPMLEFNGAFTFEYTPRDGSAAAAQSTNHQSVRMVYEDGQWKTDGFTFVSDGDYNNNIIAAM